jgi:hypothetical protein
MSGVGSGFDFTCPMFNLYTLIVHAMSGRHFISGDLLSSFYPTRQDGSCSNNSKLQNHRLSFRFVGMDNEFLDFGSFMSYRKRI